MGVRAVIMVLMVYNWSAALAKLLVGHSLGSLSLVADGYHSVVDGLSNVVGLVAITVSMAPPDEGHPYGHRKFETLASLMGAFLILLTAVEVLRDATGAGIASGAAGHESPLAGFITVISTLLMSTALATWERKQGQRLKSEFLLVDAHHTYSDVLVNGGVLISLIASWYGHPLVDRFVGGGIGFFIGAIGLNLLANPIQVLSDAQAVPVEDVERIVRAVEGISSCHKVRSRGRIDQFFFMELHIQVNPDITVREGHRLSHVVKDRLRERWPTMTDAVIHVEPDGPDHDHH